MTFVLIIVLLLGNAFFVAAQISCIAVRRDQIEPLARSGDRRARATLYSLQHIPLMLAGTQLGIALCSLGLGAVAEPGVASVLEDGFRALSLPHALLHPVAFAVALGIISFCHMVLGEMVPKNMSLSGPARVALLLSLPFGAWIRVTRPLLRLITAAADGVLRIFGVQPHVEDRGGYTPAELADVIHHSAAEGMLDPEDLQRLDRALQFDAHTAREVAIPVDQLVTVRENTTVRELEELVARTGYSRFPIAATDRPGEVVGYLHIKDTLAVPESRLDTPIATHLRRPMITVEANCPLLEACTKLQRAGSHLGRVTDGRRTFGIIALEDILETLVGTVHDASHTAG